MRHATQGLANVDTRPLEPHTRLMVAVLQAVVDDCRGSLHRRATGHAASADPAKVREAIAYVESRDRVWPFSFENICEALGMEASCLRRELRTGRTLARSELAHRPLHDLQRPASSAPDQG